MKVAYEPYAYPLERAHPEDAGADIRSPHDYHLLPFSSVVIPTGVHAELPKGTCGIIVSKSGLNVNHGITSTGLIDQNYTGEIVVKLYNQSPDTYDVKAGDKISQLVVTPCRYEPFDVVDHLEENAGRGSNGFGSTGR